MWVYILKPKVGHLGTPCTKMSRLGKLQIDEATRMQNDLSRKICVHQEANDRKASVENPGGTILFYLQEWKREFGNPEQPKFPWAFYRADGCQMGIEYPGDDDPGAPMMKSQIWMSNFDLSGMELRCKQPLALAPASHKHKHLSLIHI